MIQPYKNHKGLLQLLINCLQIDKDNQDINEKTLQVLGRFGALDPFQCEEILSGSLDRKHRYVFGQASSDRLDQNQPPAELCDYKARALFLAHYHLTT